MILAQEEIKQRVPEDTFKLIEKVQRLEKAYIVSLRKLAKDQFAAFQECKWKSDEPEVTDIAFKGNDWERWLARGRDAQQICETSPFLEAREQKSDLFRKHYHALMEACGGCMPDAVSLQLAPFSLQAISGPHGSQPRHVFPDEVNYALLMADHGLIQWAEGQGRKPGGTVRETPLEPHEKLDFDWGSWWLQLGRFDNACQLDAKHFRDCTMFWITPRILFARPWEQIHCSP